MSNHLDILNHPRAADLRVAGPSVMLVASHLLNASNSTGFFHLKLNAAASDLGMLATEIESSLAVLEKIGFLRYHAGTQVVWIIGHAARNLGKLRANNKKMIVLANAEFTAVPATCPLRVNFLWSHALMLRLEVKGAGSPVDSGFDSEGDLLADLLPKSAVGAAARSACSRNLSRCSWL
ncbi:hypothetical protein GTP44_15400 [Duganella sp. FT50W]|uniref:Uncharacterized protein n=1 Tax=Duganella lactea TaxID=2692173 RepID=A0A6L8MN98_9BURK|nr:hypothetical protein [Duganella lactea]MYM83336.1 hypothetical protein [Duganella lactea]